MKDVNIHEIVCKNEQI